jgi:Fe-S-cluster containining protein
MGAMLTVEEYEQLKKYLAKNKYGRMLYERGIRTIWKYISKGTIYWLCPFSYNKRCQIYSMRPQICRSFHCDRPQEENREFRDTYDRHSHTIADLFRKDSFDLFKKLKGGN